jgi:hypothetical protein
VSLHLVISRREGSCAISAPSSPNTTQILENERDAPTSHSLTMSTTSNIRISGFIERRPDLTEGQFYEPRGIYSWISRRTMGGRAQHHILLAGMSDLLKYNAGSISTWYRCIVFSTFCFAARDVWVTGTKVHTNCERRVQWSAMLGQGDDSLALGSCRRRVASNS